MGDAAMDDTAMDDTAMDPHGGAEPPGFEQDGLAHDGRAHDGLAHDGLAHDGGPEPGIDDRAGANAGWPEDPDLAGAQPADLSYAEDYPAGDLPDGTGVEEPLFGAEPDLYPLADAALGEDEPFPPALDLEPPEPIDGHPWADPAVLGHDVLPPFAASTAGPDPAELFEYAGEQPPSDGDAWSALLASPDPATSALARWWSAG